MCIYGWIRETNTSTTFVQCSLSCHRKVGKIGEQLRMGGESSSSSSVMVYRLDRKSSIENEPRTLNIHQIQFARDAALSVLNTTSIEEAFRIFTEGLEPVVSCVHDNEEKDGMMEYEEDEEEEGSYNLLRIPSALRDIASAPF